MRRAAPIDVARHQEKFVIPCVNQIDTEVYPTGFNYISTNIPSQTRPATVLAELDGCCCTEEAQCSNDGCSCFCLRGSHNETQSLLFECNKTCSCPPLCNNRRAQNGVNVPVYLVKHKSKGWCIHTSEFIEAGKFVAEYVGEVCSEEEARARNLEVLETTY